MADDQSKVSKGPQLMRDGRLLHADGGGKRADGARPLAQAPEDEDATGGGECAHRFGYRHGDLRIDRSRRRPAVDTVSHARFTVA